MLTDIDSYWFLMWLMGRNHVLMRNYGCLLKIGADHSISLQVWAVVLFFTRCALILFLILSSQVELSVSTQLSPTVRSILPEGRRNISKTTNSRRHGRHLLSFLSIQWGKQHEDFPQTHRSQCPFTAWLQLTCLILILGSKFFALGAEDNLRNRDISKEST